MQKEEAKVATQDRRYVAARDKLPVPGLATHVPAGSSNGGRVLTATLATVHFSGGKLVALMRSGRRRRAVQGVPFLFENRRSNMSVFA